MKALILSFLLIPLLLAAGLYGLFLVWGNHLPVPGTAEELKPSARSVVYDRNGEVIGSYYVENRNPVPLAKVPPLVVRAVLAAEDHRFYQHWGINAVAFVRAAFRNLRAGEVTQGASTITMQLARNLFLDQSRTLERKLKEIVLAVRLERSFSKDEILELYLNRIYFGEGAYGVQAAARRYFGRDVGDLTVSQAAMLAGLPANPAAFSPVRHPKAALNRRNRVLNAMRGRGDISTGVFEDAITQPLGVLAGSSPAGEAPYFLEYVRTQLIGKYGSHGLFEGGLQIHTTLDLDLQRAAERAIETQCEKIEEDHLYRETFASYREAGAHGEDEDSTPYLQSALIALDPQTGRMLAMVGGRSWQDSHFNRAVQARRQPGSSFKPFIYAMALRDGSRPNDIIVDEPVSYPMGHLASMGTYSPHNFSRKFEGPIPLAHALAKSINIPSVKLLKRLGPRTVVDFAAACGIRGDLPPYLSLALGTGEVTPIEMASAYGGFDNLGMRVSPLAVTSVDDPLGRVLEEDHPTTSEILDEKTSAMLVAMMRGVIDHGTAATARTQMKFEAPAAGKTGTTDDYTDAWFIGFVPRCVCAVWVGFDEKRTLGSGMTGAKAALPIWIDFMKEFVRTAGEEDFTIPAGLVPVTICDRTGLLAGPYCPSDRLLFLPGTEPRRTCQIHGAGYQEPPEEEPSPDTGW